MATYQNCEGFSELAETLRKMKSDVRTKILKPAVGAAAKVIRTEAKLMAPVYHGQVSQGHPPPGTLKKAIIMKSIREQSSDTQQVYYVTVLRGKKRQAVEKKRKGTVVSVTNLDAFYWFFVEFGTSKMAAHPFMRPAFEKKKTDAIDAMAERIKAGINESTGGALK